MLNIIIIPVFILAGLAIYAVAEEAVEWKTGRRYEAATYDRARRWLADSVKYRAAAEQKISEEIDAAYESPLYRARLWLAGKIAP